MASKRSPAGRVVDFFQHSDYLVAKTAFDISKEVMKRRTGEEESLRIGAEKASAPKVRKARKSKVNKLAAADSAVQTASA